MTVAHPAVVFETGDRTEFYTTLIMVNTLEDVGAALMELDVNLGHPIIYVHSSKDRIVSTAFFAPSNPVATPVSSLDLDLIQTWFKEIDLVCDSARVRHHKQP